MTAMEWEALEVGDVVLDHRANGSPERTVLTVKRRFVRKGCVGPGHWSTIITVTGLGKRPSVTVFQSCDWLNGVGKRFTLKDTL